MDFKDWLRSMGATVEVTEEDDGSGYEVLAVTVHDDTADDKTYDVTVTT